MHPTNARMMARQMLDEQGLYGWGFKINTNKRRLGVCKYIHRRIEISKFHLDDGEDAVKDTIAHEIAHAVVGRGHGHDHVWRSKAIELGSSGNRLGKPMEAVTYKWQTVCPKCGVIGVTHRRHCKKRFSCRRCSGGVFTTAFLLQYKPNYAGLLPKDIVR